MALSFDGSRIGALMAATLLKKLDKAREGHDAAASIRQRFRVVVSRAGQDFSGLAVAVTGASQSEATLAEIETAVSAFAGSFILRDAAENSGLVCFDDQVCSGLLEHATTGRVVPGNAPERTLTRTDAVLLGEFVNALLTRFEGDAAGQELPHGAGFRFDRQLGRKAAVELSFRDTEYLSYRVQVDLANGEKAGEINLFLPFTEKISVRSRQPLAEWNAEWESQVSRSQVLIEAILHRLRIPLKDVEELVPGHMFVIPTSQISRVAVVGGNGRVVCRGKLGRQGQFRAVRLHGEFLPSASLAMAQDIGFSTQQVAAQPNVQPPMTSEEPE